MRIGSLESGTQDPSQGSRTKIQPGKQQGGVGTRVDWMATTCLLLLVPCREVDLVRPYHLIFQEKLQNWILILNQTFKKAIS